MGNEEKDILERMANLTVKEYRQLLEDQKFLECLKAAGVDNWGGYEDAIQMMKENE